MISGPPGPDPCYEDLPSFTLDHDLYDADKHILVDAVDPCRTISLSQAREKVDKLARGFSAIGVCHGDTVCVVHMNDIMYPIVFLAITKIGARYAGANPSYTSTELGHHFSTSETKFIISDLARLPTIMVSSLGLVPRNNVILWDPHSLPSVHQDLHTLDTLMQMAETCRAPTLIRFNDKHLSTTTTAALMSTSGTTGLPKMASRSHHSWVYENQCIQPGPEHPLPYVSKRLLFVPFFHGFAAPLALIDALRSGIETWVMARFDLTKCLDLIKRHEITEVAMPPPVLIRLMSLSAEELLALQSIRLVWCGGARITAETQNAALNLFHPEARIVQVYGMTEGGWMSTFKYPERDTTGSVGHLLPSFSAKILDGQGAPVPSCSPQQGLLQVHSPIIMQNYHHNVHATNEILDQQGWLNTGDVAYFCSSTHKLYICDREKDILKFRGWQVSPAEIESCLLSHVGVEDAAAVGVFDENLKEEIGVVFVVLKKGVFNNPKNNNAIKHSIDNNNPNNNSSDSRSSNRVSEPETSKKECSKDHEDGKEVKEMLMEHLAEKLAKYKVQGLAIKWIDAIPKSLSGKILRKELRQLVVSES